MLVFNRKINPHCVFYLQAATNETDTSDMNGKLRRKRRELEDNKVRIQLQQTSIYNNLVFSHPYAV